MSPADEATRKERNHNCARATERVKEVGNEPASRRTETEYEAVPSRTSWPVAAKLQWPRGSGVDPAVVQQSSVLLSGEISRCA